MLYRFFFSLPFNATCNINLQEDRIKFKFQRKCYSYRNRIETHLWSYYITLELFSSTLFILHKLISLHARIENIISKSVRFKIYITRANLFPIFFFFNLIFIIVNSNIAFIKKIRCDIYRRITRDSSKNFIIWTRVCVSILFFFFFPHSLQLKIKSRSDRILI